MLTTGTAWAGKTRSRRPSLPSASAPTPRGFTGSYTPQAVVNGRYEFVGSQRARLAEAIARAAQTPRANVQLSRATAGSLAIKINALPTGTGTTDVMLAFTETGLSTQVGRGDNSGPLLRHAAVVRALCPLAPRPPVAR